MSKKKDRGWEYLHSDNKNCFDYDPDNDGSWGYQNKDGSGSYYGSDGSWGYKNADGSGSYYGQDGSWGYRNSDGSGSYYGEDGSWGYRNSDGSGSYYGADGGSEYYNAIDDKDSSNSDSGAEALGTLLAFGLAAFMVHKSNNEQKCQVEERRQEQEQLRREAEEQVKKERTRARRATRVSFYKRHWKAILILLVTLVGSGFGYYKYSEFQKGIIIGSSSASLIGNEYTTVEDILKEAGFTNIHEDAISDLGIKDFSREGIVSKVSIHGNTDFDATTKYPYDSRVVITYHLVENIDVPMSAKEAKKLNYTDLEKQFIDAGFVNVKTEIDYDLITGWITKDGSIESISINGETSFDEFSSYRPDAEVIITYHTFSKNKGD